MSDATRESMLDLAPAYALGALSPEETRAFEAELANSPALRREVAEYRELNAYLASGSAVTPAPELKRRLRERIAAGKIAPLSKRGSFVTVALGAGLAATLVLSVGLSLKVRALTGNLRVRDSAIADAMRHLAEREATLNSILEPGVELTTMVATGEAPPVVQLFHDRNRNTILLHSFRLAPAPAGRVYQLWFMRKNATPLPSQVFNTETDGHQLVEAIKVPADQEITGFALTVEPEGGSLQPTSTPILYGAIAGTR